MEKMELLSNGNHDVGRSPSGGTQETIVASPLETPQDILEKDAKMVRNRMFSKDDTMNDDDAAFESDPYNKPELIHTLKGRELWLFVLFYIGAVSIIVLMFEFFMPVLFNPNYPNDP